MSLLETVPFFKNTKCSVRISFCCERDSEEENQCIRRQFTAKRFFCQKELVRFDPPNQSAKLLDEILVIQTSPRSPTGNCLFSCADIKKKGIRNVVTGCCFCILSLLRFTYIAVQLFSCGHERQRECRPKDGPVWRQHGIQVCGCWGRWCGQNQHAHTIRQRRFSHRVHAYLF